MASSVRMAERAKCGFHGESGLCSRCCWPVRCNLSCCWRWYFQRHSFSWSMLPLSTAWCWRAAGISHADIIAVGSFSTATRQHFLSAGIRQPDPVQLRRRGVVTVAVGQHAAACAGGIGTDGDRDAGMGLVSCCRTAVTGPDTGRGGPGIGNAGGDCRATLKRFKDAVAPIFVRQVWSCQGRTAMTCRHWSLYPAGPRFRTASARRHGGDQRLQASEGDR